MGINNFAAPPKDSGFRPFYIAELLILGGLIILMALGVYFSFTAQKVPYENQQIILDHQQDTIDKLNEIQRIYHAINLKLGIVCEGEGSGIVCE